MAGLELHEAASTGDYDSLEEYIKSGKYDLNLKDAEWKNKTALHWAASKGYIECIRLLLDNGAKGTVRMDMGWTPAHCAAEAGKLTALRALHAANVPVDLKDKYGDTPRRIAQIYNHAECTSYLEQAEQEIAERQQRMSQGGQQQGEWSDDENDDDDDDDDDEDEQSDVVDKSSFGNFMRSKLAQKNKPRCKMGHLN